jgi:hypothetical protein
MMSNDLIGFKRCENNHILGQMRRNGTGTELLELFRQAIDYDQDMPEAVDVIGIFSAGQTIRCSICGSVVDFHQARLRRRFAARAAFE